MQTKVNDAVDGHAEDPSECAQAGGAAKCIARTRAVTSLSEKRNDKPYCQGSADQSAAGERSR